MAEVRQVVQGYDSWHQNQMITKMNKNGRGILEQGGLYSYGRDHQYCPIIIVKAQAVDIQNHGLDGYFNAIHALLLPLEKHMLFPGVIQKWNVIIDFQNKRCKNINITQLGRLADAYPYRLKRVLFINSNKNQQIVAAIKDMLIQIRSDAHVQTIKNLQQLTRIISKQERQERYGGTQRNLCEYWPIRTTNHTLQQSIIMQTEDKTEYQSVNNNQDYFQTNTPFCDLSNSKCQIY